MHCPVESFGLLFLNSPYDWTIGESRSERTERVFLAHAYRWLKPDGVLILVVPAERVRECGDILASHFKDLEVYRLTEPEAVRYRQVVVLARRRTPRERERLRDDDIIRRRAWFACVGQRYGQLAVLAERNTPQYAVPEGGPVKIEYRGLPLDLIEDLLPRSPAYRQAARILFPQRAAFKGRPLTPLHAGHVALCAVSGMLDGIFGCGESRRIAVWQAAMAEGLEVTLYPYMIETCADETWQLDHFPTQRERAALDDWMAPWDLEEALAVRASSDDARDFDVVWVDPPRHFNGQPTMYPEIAEGRAQTVDPDLPALLHLHACEYSATGYFGNEGSDVDLYIYCALHVAIPPYGEGARAVTKTKPFVVSSSARRGDKKRG